MPTTATSCPFPPPATLVWERTEAANKSAIANQQSAIANHSHIVNRCSVFGVQNTSAFVNRCSLFGVPLLSSTDYFPFGMPLAGRNFVGVYRYGFNGMEKDDEVNGGGNSYTTEFRMLDVRIGRWWSTDPVVHHFQSPYCTFDNNPILISDPSGADGDDPPDEPEKASIIYHYDQNSYSGTTPSGKQLGFDAAQIYSFTTGNLDGFIYGYSLKNGERYFWSAETQNYELGLSFEQYMALRNPPDCVRLPGQPWSLTQVTTNTWVVQEKFGDYPKYIFNYPQDLGEFSQPGSDGLIWTGCMSCHSQNGAYRYAAYNSQGRLQGLLLGYTITSVVDVWLFSPVIATKGGIQLTKGTFGHTFTTHGDDMTNFLVNRAKGSGMAQGQFLDNQKAAQFILDNVGKTANGAVNIPIPNGFPARIIMPDGTFKAATHIRLVPGGGGVKTAYPLIP